MAKGEHILISLEERHAENIFTGHKQIELRRRTMNVNVGAVVWIYVKSPVGSVVGRARVSALCVSSPFILWRQFSAVSGLSRSEFFRYFNGVQKGIALVLEDAERLSVSTSLEKLRRASAGFHPPQFFMRLGDGCAVLRALESTTEMSYE